MHISFVELEVNNSQNLSSQFAATMTVNATDVTFRIMNDISVAYASVTGVYFYDGVFIDISQGVTYQGSSGVTFSTPANPGHLSGFSQDALAVFSSGGSPGNPSNGIDAPGEWLDVTFALQTGVTFGTLANAVANDLLRIGLKVQSIAGGTGDDSETYISQGGHIIIPLPTAGMLALGGLLGIGAVRRRRA